MSTKSYSEYVADWQKRNRSLAARMVELTGGIDFDRFNRHPQPDIWSPAQVVEHLVLTNKPYLKAIEFHLKDAPRCPGAMPVRFSLAGKLIRYAAGPLAITPVPEPLVPRPLPIPLELLDRWFEQQNAIISLVDQAEGVDLSSVGLPNPLIPQIRMNLADCFEILTVHTERHIAQIEERLKSA